MECERFTERLHELLDQRVDPSEDHQLEQHARACLRCRRQLGSWTAVQSCWTAPPAAGHHAGWGWPIAVVLIVAGVIGWGMSRPGSKTDDWVAVSAPAVSPAPDVVLQEPSLEALVQLEASQLPSWHISQWARDAWEPMLEGIRPVTGSLNVAVRAFSPSSVHLRLEPADQSAVLAPHVKFAA